MDMKKRILFFAVSLLLLVSCKEDNQVKIGVILPLTGDVATYGTSVKEGLDIAVEEFSENSKYKYKLIYQDSKAQKNPAINAVEFLSGQGIKFFIGDATSTVTYAIGPKINSIGGLLVVPIATGDDILKTPNVFMISPRNEKQTWKIIDFIRNENINKVGCLFKQNEYGVNIANTFLDSISTLGIETYSQAYQEGQNEFRSLLRKFEEREIQTIFVPGNYEETALILKQSQELAQNITFIGTDGCYSPDLIKLAGSASESFLLTMMPLKKDSELYVKFASLYKDKHGKEPDVFTCYGYETFSILFNAIENSSTLDINNVVSYLENNSFNSLTNTLKFKNREADREYQIYKIENSNFVPTEK